MTSGLEVSTRKGREVEVMVSGGTTSVSTVGNSGIMINVIPWVEDPCVPVNWGKYMDRVERDR